MVGGGQPLHLNFARSASALKPGEISPVIANRKSSTCFPISLNWTACVAPSPLEGAQKRKIAVFHLKVHFSRRKSATKFLGAKTISGKVENVRPHNQTALISLIKLHGKLQTKPTVSLAKLEIT